VYDTINNEMVWSHFHNIVMYKDYLDYVDPYTHAYTLLEQVYELKLGTNKAKTKIQELLDIRVKKKKVGEAEAQVIRIDDQYYFRLVAGGFEFIEGETITVRFYRDQNKEIEEITE
jgi:hypothetical protein